ncbi:MAG TPA: bifunctional diaminohydroxyphosphoribosylaminopyrimidine deaminase/5-amino-6-(5-phosphoribosylamino)uracil reductase RibD [Verrucomicrobiae bacterium]|nr:bifunctional diaminohydroxyphosphoribosylaminopyrimidine deaminase/5-amino-6-(5-phosphoribosylamino)uracil reductase RibD [Verrucomicrobiae bacterium]
MARALELGRRGLNTSTPNPSVGCVIVRDGEVVGEGFHAVAGQPHAEPLALQHAGDKARGAEMFLTLEPCSHHGRTPPCVDAVIAAGVRKVWAATQDPNPKVCGRGLAKLREAGIEVDVGLMQAEALALHRGFISRMTRGRPFTSLKLAMSLDGRTAMRSGESQWLTSTGARADVHRLRAQAGAVLTSVETVLADDPQLNVRDWRAPHPGPLPASGEREKIRQSDIRQPDRIVLDTRLRSPVTAKVWAPGARRIALTARPQAEKADALRDAGVEVVELPTSHERVDLGAAMAALGRLEVNEILVESGPRLAGALLQEGLVDELVVYMAPSLLGDEARPLAALPGLSQLEQRVRLRYTDVATIGPDIRITASCHPERSEGSRSGRSALRNAVPRRFAPRDDN